MSHSTPASTDSSAELSMHWALGLSIIVFLLTVIPITSHANELTTTANKQRPAWTTSNFAGTPEPPLPLRIERWGNTEFNQPVAIDAITSSISIDSLQRTGSLFVLERRGGIHRIDLDNPNSSRVLLDLSQVATAAGEKLAACRDLAADPQFETNGYIYVFWAILPHLTEGGSRVSRFTCDVNDLGEVSSIDPASRLDIITYPSGDHVGASLNFGPNGYLWATSGDGSRPFPPDQYRKAQDPNDFRGKVLRLDVSHATESSPYVIPNDNPFSSNPDIASEIYAAGLRNGFRASFSPYDDSFWVGDVGWEQCEMIHKIQPGGNCGWSLYEGPHPIAPDQPTAFGEIIPPAIIMDRSKAQSITGGLFPSKNWRVPASELKAEQCYMFGCYMNGMIWAGDASCDPVSVHPVASTGLKLIDFLELDLTPDDQNQSTDILIVDLGGGGLHRLAPNSASKSQTFPRRLSETGLFVDTAQMIPASGVLEYQPNVEMNRGVATTRRWIASPGNEPLPVQPSGDHHPYVSGTTVALTIFRDVAGSDEPQPIETQVLVADEIRWTPYTYRWLEDGSDAELVPAEGDRRELTIRDPRFGDVTYEHVFASRTQCLACHHVANRGPMTFRPDQLTRVPPSRSVNGSYTTSLMDWQSMVASGWADPAKKITRNVRPMRSSNDQEATLEDRAKSYLAMNCSSCHRPAGGAATNLDLRWKRSLEQTNALDQPPLQGDFGLPDARILAPGHPECSVLLYRAMTSGAGAMPKLAHHDLPPEALSVLWEWISSMPTTTPQDSDLEDASPSTPAISATMQLAYEFAGKTLNSETAGPSELRSKAAMLSDAADTAITDAIGTESAPLIRGLMRPWLNPEKRVKLVGNAPDLDRLVALKGDAEEGRRWFAAASGSQCQQCHRVGDVGRVAGPDIAAFAKEHTTKELLSHIVDPSLKIDPKWRTIQILTIDGATLSGIAIESDENVVLTETNGRVHELSIDDIEARRVLEQSPMPMGLLAQMTEKQVANLIAFLRQAPTEEDTPDKEDEMPDDRTTIGQMKDCPVMESNGVRVILGPIGGRVLQYSRQGIDALFLSDADQDQPGPTGSQTNWSKNPSAGRFDIGPELMIGPRKEWQKAPWEVERLDELSVRMTSPINERLSLRLIREFTLNPMDGSLTCKQSVENVGDKPFTYCHWSRTLVRGGGMFVIPREGFRRFPNGYVRYENGAMKLRPEDDNVIVNDDFLIQTGPPLQPKLGMDTMANWAAVVWPDRWAFVKRFEMFPDLPYLEAGALTFSTWQPSTGETIEVEPIGPAQTVAPGETASYTETWNLERMPSNAIAKDGTLNPEVVSKAVDRLARSSN